MRVTAKVVVLGFEEKFDLSPLPVGALPRIGESFIIGIGTCKVTDVIWDLLRDEIFIHGTLSDHKNSQDLQRV